MTMVNAFSAEHAGALSSMEREMITRREQIVGPAFRLFYRHPVHFVRSEGVWLYDAAGHRYLDAYNNVPSVGHCNPRVVDAIHRQSGTLNTHSRYLLDGVLDYAEDLLSTFPEPLDRVMFTCSGSEANDLALRMVGSYTGGEGIVITEWAYHGVTTATAGISPSLSRHMALPAHVRTIPAPDTYRGTGEDVADRLASAVSAAIEDLKASGIKPAALVLDSIFTSDGLFPAPAGFLKRAVEIAQYEGLLYVADEVQSGFGRTGKDLWGFRNHGVTPDIVTLGKPMANGYPLSGTVARGEIIDHFGRNMRHFNTHGGNPVACAAGQAVLDYIRGEDILRRCRESGAYLKAGLQRLAEKFEVIGDIRGEGLFLAVEMVADRQTKAPSRDLATFIVNDLRERRILISSSGPAENLLKIRPLLVSEKEHLDILLNGLDASLGKGISLLGMG